MIFSFLPPFFFLSLSRLIMQENSCGVFGKIGRGIYQFGPGRGGKGVKRWGKWGVNGFRAFVLMNEYLNVSYYMREMIEFYDKNLLARSIIECAFVLMKGGGGDLKNTFHFVFFKRLGL